MKRTRHATPLLLACLLALGAAGCSDDVEPRFEPATSPSVSATPSTTPSAEPTPVALGPEETVRAWVEARNRTVQDGSTTDVYALSADGCETCADSVEPVRQVYSAGGRFETPGWTVVKSRVVSASDRDAEVSVALVYEAGRTLPSAGAEPIRYDQVRRIAKFRLVRNSGEWLVSFIGYLS